MKIKKHILIVLTIITTFIGVLLYTNSSLATDTESNFEISSDSAILIDSNTGKVLYGKNENEKLYPASTTKILTAILAIEKCNLTDKIPASKSAVMSIPAGYSNAAIQPGEALTVQDLLDLFLIHSANEVGYIFAEHISGSVENFATLMNQKATELGCKNTHFTNPSGIHDPEHYSTAYDMALIAKYCMKNETFRSIVSKTSCTIEATDKYEKRYFKNTNDLIIPSSEYYYENAIGVKTGYTSQAKSCLISASLKDNFELITVVLGAKPLENRYVDTINLFEYGYSNYTIQKIATKNSVIDNIDVKNATKDTKNLDLILKDDIIALTPKDFLTDAIVTINQDISAPISEGDVLGKITYNIDGLTYSSDLIASHSVEKFNVPLLIAQIVIAIFVLFILAKLFSPKKKSKNKKKKNGKSKSKKNKTKKYNNSLDSIYKFN